MGEEIDLKSLMHDYKREGMDETYKKLQKGEYVPGKIYAQQFPDDVADTLETLLFLQNFNEITINVKKDVDGYHLSFEVISKK